MSELKTLKDILHCDCGICDHDKKAIELKQEAIKWIKALEDEKLKVDEDESIEDLIGKIGWIKNFFNITEDDIKILDKKQ